MALTGSEFKQLYPNTTFYKLTNITENHNNYQYNDGLNTDTKIFKPSLSCNGGMYFTDIHNIGLWLTHINTKYIREVEIVDDSLVCIEDKKFKTNKFILKKRTLLKDFVFWNDNDFCLLTIVQNGNSLEYVQNQTEEICLAAVKQNGYALKYVQNQTEEICLAAVRQNGDALEYVHNQTEEICLAAVKKDGLVLCLVKDQTEEICLAAVKQNEDALRYVNNQTKEIYVAAINENPDARHYKKDTCIIV
jgi:3-dehydroquinate synthase class II